MPIYAYRCSSCGFAQDVLRKMSDPLLTVCPNCGQPSFVKQVTAAGFQLKGSGWYVTDFRDGKKSGDTDSKADAGKAETAGGDKPGATAPAGEAGSAAPAAPAASSAPAAAAAAAPAASPAPAAAPPAPGKSG